MSPILWKRQRSEGKEYGDEAAPNVKRNLLVFLNPPGEKTVVD